MGDTFLDRMWPIHSGKTFGWPSRILVCLTGLACPVPYIIGVIRWPQKRRAKRLKTPVLDQRSHGATNRITARND
nr:PepSY-associated TM helix domain-containing protein [Methylocaldum szegediense]